eukprot:GEZU01023853.1.p1 GENE.GEZU01023853.1~~GEZU01023853.1.p1  ORF type:complete len:263 (-),score=37.60 GEZU01023853.1:253-1041(-)
MDHKTLAYFCGYTATLAFTLQYLPQIYLNQKRKSVKGFSTSGIIIKLVGAAFLFTNTIFTSESFPLVLYGLFNVAQHIIFILQFVYFTQNVRWLGWLLFPLVPFTLGATYPQTMAYTNLIKPLTQVLSHAPQLRLCMTHRSTHGVSFLSQHLNLIGGLAGLIMCFIVQPKSHITYMVYAFSCLQALSLYALALYYKELPNLYAEIPFMNRTSRSKLAHELRGEDKDEDQGGGSGNDLLDDYVKPTGGSSSSSRAHTKPKADA